MGDIDFVGYLHIVEFRYNGFQGPTNFICYRQNSVIANKRNERKQVEGTKNLVPL